MPTAGEYRVVEAVVQSCRLPVELRMCGIGPGRAAALCAEFERGARPRGLALLGWAGGLRDDLAVGDIVIADRALSAGRSDVNCLALPLPGTARVHRGPVLTADHVVAAPAAKRAAAGVRCAGRGNGSLPAGSLGCAVRSALCSRPCDPRHGKDALPALDGVLDGYGRLQIRPLLGALAGRPALLGEFTRLALRLRGVNRRLAELAEAVVAGMLQP